MQDVELGPRRGFKLGERSIARPLRNHAQPHLLQQNAAGPGIAADVVVADDGHIVRRALKARGFVTQLVEDPVADGVVGDVMAERMRYSAKPLAADRYDRLAVLLAFGLCYALDIVSDQANRALGLNRDSLVQRKEHLDLIYDLRQLLVAAEDDVLFLKVRGELQRHKGVHSGGPDKVVAARGPGVLPAADRPVADVDHVLDRAPDHSLRPRIGAAAYRHHARNGLDVGLDCALPLVRFVGRKVLGAPLGELLRVGPEDLTNHLLVSRLGLFNVHDFAHASPRSRWIRHIWRRFQ